MYFIVAYIARMDTHSINIFLAVIEQGSFASVAETRNLAPSSVSRTIASLEAELSVRLFNRTTRKLTPTQAAEAFYKKMRPLAEGIESAIREVSETQTGPSGVLRVAASVSYGQLLLAKKLEKFLGDYPNVRLDLLLSDRRIDLIQEGVDVAIRHGELEDSSLISRKLCDVKYKLVASPTYLENKGKPQSIEALHLHSLLSFGIQGFSKTWMFKKQETYKTLNIAPRILSSNAMALRQCALDNLGIAMLADWTVADDLKADHLVEVLPEWDVAGSSFKSAIWLVYPSMKFVPARTRAFLDFMKSR